MQTKMAQTKMAQTKTAGPEGPAAMFQSEKSDQNFTLMPSA
jgi:hypothetical protein